MIYFDNAATTLQKPIQVARAVEAAMMSCANPGRSGHKPALHAAQVVFQCRMDAAELFGVPRPEQVVFTCNATHALNIAIKSLLHNGGHAVVTGYEHNSVVRPLEAMVDQGVTYTVAYAPLFDREANYHAICGAVTEETKCVILNHVSNVFGFVLPLMEIDEFCYRRGIPLIVDASQSAGILPLSLEQMKSVEFLCMPGHKSLYGPQGTGLLVCQKEEGLYSLTEGGTGSNSLEVRQPDFLPDLLESGTLNVPGIAGLDEGIRFVQREGLESLAAHKRFLLRKTAEGLDCIPNVEVFYAEQEQEALLSFRAKQMSSSALCEELAQLGICLRDGLHCSPLAHKSAGTLPDGTVRVSFSCFNQPAQVGAFLTAVKKVLTN